MTRNRIHGARLAFAIAGVFFALFGMVSTAAAASPQFGTKDQSFTGASTAPSGSKPESKLWFNAGRWWAVMWDTTSVSFRIFRADAAGQTWQNTGTTIDTRGTTRSDALWDGTHLYIASHDVAADSIHNTVNRPALLYRYSYNGATATYSLDAGFPITLLTVATETLVIDKDSTGTLWATWTQNRRPVVAHTTVDDRTWTAGFTPPVTGTTLTSDDISSLIAFGGNKIGVMWSNQSDSHMYFTSHLDGAADSAWTPAEAATTGAGSADDHINLKTDSAGRVYAAVKTSLTAPVSTLIQLLVRGTGGGWAAHPLGTVTDSHTRPIVLIDEQHGIVHAFATGRYPGAASGQSGGTIYEKTAAIGAIAFAAGSGTPFIQDPTSSNLNNASSTKQNVSAATGLLVLATNDSTKFYWHATEALGTPGPTPVSNFTANVTSGTAPLTVQFIDQSTNGPSRWAWSFGDGATSTVQNPAHQYTLAGTYTVTLTASNANGTGTTNTKTGFITVTAPAPTPVSNFIANVTSGTAPLTVQFTDQSTNTPTSWAWSFGDGATSTVKNPAHQYTQAGTYTVTLTASNANGTGTTNTKTGFITVTAPGGTTLTFNPVADAQVTTSNVTANYGTLATMKLREGDGSTTNPTYHDYLKFSLAGVTGSVTTVKLRLFVTDASVATESVFVISDNSWTETGITYANAPQIPTVPAAGSATAPVVGAYVEITLAPTTVTSSTTTLSLAVRSSAADSLVVSSREDVANKPQLQVAFN